MKMLQRIGVSLLFALPVAAVFALLLLTLIRYYDAVYAMYLGPVLTLWALILGPYSLILIGMSYNTLKRQGWRIAWRDHVWKPITRILPMMVLIGIALWAWICLVMIPVKLIIPGGLPEKLIFMIGSILFVAEALKTRNRIFALTDYRKQRVLPSAPSSEPLKWDTFRLLLLAYTQSVLFLIGGWGGILIAFTLAREAMDAWAPQSLQQIVYLMIVTGCILGIRKLEKRAETYGRDEQYIPWDSGY